MKPRYLRPLLAVAASAVVIAGCGSSGPTDREQIAAVIKHEGTSPSSLCSHLTDALLLRLGGSSGCLHQAGLAAPDPTTHAASIQVHGRTATAVVVDKAGTRSLSLVKQKGIWKIAGVA